MTKKNFDICDSHSYQIPQICLVFICLASGTTFRIKNVGKVTMPVSLQMWGLLGAVPGTWLVGASTVLQIIRFDLPVAS